MPLAGHDRLHRGGHGKKLVGRDPLLDLAAFYAPRGIPPAAVLGMSAGERLVLRVGRARYYEEQAALIRAGVLTALAPPETEGRAHGEE